MAGTSVRHAIALALLLLSGEGCRVQSGDLVELEGVTSSGHFQPVLAGGTVHVLVKAPYPVPRRPADRDLAAGREGAQWVGIAGLVQSAGQDSNRPRVLLKV